MLDLVTNLSRRPGTAPNAISRKMRPAILHHSQTRKFIVEPGLDSFGAVKASRPEEANDVGAADDDHRMPISSYLLIRLPVHVRRCHKDSELAVTEPRYESCDVAGPDRGWAVTLGFQGVRQFDGVLDRPEG